MCKNCGAIENALDLASLNISKRLNSMNRRSVDRYEAIAVHDRKIVAPN